MADVEKININSTDYDIADAKALRTKDTVGTGSFIDTRAGTSTYPTTEAHTDSIIIGKGANVRSNQLLTNVVIVGNNSLTTSSFTTTVGYSASTWATRATAIGFNASVTKTYGTALGCGASVTGNYSLAVGYNATTSTAYNVALGSNAKTEIGVNSVAIGYNATTSSGSSVALGSNAKVPTNKYGAVQLGEGTAQYDNSLQFRNYPLVSETGKIFLPRLPDEVRTTGDHMPNLYEYDISDISKVAHLYLGSGLPFLDNGKWYMGDIKQGKPCVWCSYVYDEYIKQPSDILIDQDKFFQKIAEIAQEKVDNDDIVNNFIGGSMGGRSFLYFFHDSDGWGFYLDETYFDSEFGNTPDNITGIQDLTDFGIYLPDYFDVSSVEDEADVFDISYIPPVYCDDFHTRGTEGLFTVDYLKFMTAMCNSTYGFGAVVPNLQQWNYTVDGHNYSMPIVPDYFINLIDGHDVDYIDFGFAYDHDDDGPGLYSWYLELMEVRVGLKYSDAQMKSIFGIDLLADGQQIDTVKFTFKGAQQRFWKEFNPISVQAISNYVAANTQFISHDSLGNLTWAAGGSSYSAGSGIDITSNVISVDDLDCGTM